MAEVSDDDRDVPASTVPLINDDRDYSGDEQEYGDSPVKSSTIRKSTHVARKKKSVANDCSTNYVADRSAMGDLESGSKAGKIGVVSSISSKNEKEKTNILPKTSFLYIVCFMAVLATGITCAYTIYCFYGKNNLKSTKNTTLFKNAKHEFIGEKETQTPAETASSVVKAEDEVFKDNNVGKAKANVAEASSALIQETVSTQINAAQVAQQAQQQEVPAAAAPPAAAEAAESGQASQPAGPSESNAAPPAESEEDLKKRQSMLTAYGGLEKVCASMRAAQLLEAFQRY